VKFENGAMEFRLGIASDGTIVLLAWGDRGKALARIPSAPSLKNILSQSRDFFRATA